MLARQHQVQGGLRAHEARRALRAARARQQAQRHLGQPQPGARQRDAVMRGQRHFQPAAQRGAVQHGHHGLGAGFDLVAEVGQDGRLRRFAEFADVGAGDEVPPGAGQHDGAHLRVRLGVADGRSQVGAHGGAQRIDRRMVDGDDKYVFIAAREGGAGACAVCHGQCLRQGSPRARPGDRGGNGGAWRARAARLFLWLYSFSVNMS
ncbi:hypothetical protein D9M68_779760 [compost metagenome]